MATTSRGAITTDNRWRLLRRLGIIKEFNINQQWSWGFGTGFGVAHEADEDNDLGYDLEFFTRLTLAYQLKRHQQIRLKLGHLSNANLGDKNPGAETLTLGWSYQL